MVLGIAEDFSSNVDLDEQLKQTPTSGLYVNSGVHPSITVENLLAFLPNKNISFSVWDSAKNYGVFETSRKLTDVVSHDDKVWQSIQQGVNQEPGEGSEYWLETNIESLRIKNFLFQVLDKVYADLSLTKSLVNNSFIYEVGKTPKQLPNDYAGWVFEPKGSDYVFIRVNQIVLQKNGTTPVDLYVINQNQVLQTIQVTPSNGRVVFENVNIVLSGKGKWILAIDSTDVITNSGAIDHLKYDGFVCYTTTGIGVTPQTAVWDYGISGNGIGLNVSAYLDAKVFIDNNLQFMGNFVRACFEYMVFQMYLHNANNRSNREQVIQMSDELLLTELKSGTVDSVFSRYEKEKKKVMQSIQKVFDTHLFYDDSLQIEINSP